MGIAELYSVAWDEFVGLPNSRLVTITGSRMKL
ncbi:hypothetical protein HNR48_002538 [Pseudoteredinibacter isoporae]|uniref:Uncharacterized protein n=1 Tax=Pseudoteredinibacter isoporae TaxID=570281 RepID=A0A7X0JU14_9GAMM|nr:hypothetical protein [Pseudoteredinibacter isoporae]